MIQSIPTPVSVAVMAERVLGAKDLGRPYVRCIDNNAMVALVPRRGSTDDGRFMGLGVGSMLCCFDVLAQNSRGEQKKFTIGFEPSYRSDYDFMTYTGYEMVAAHDENDPNDAMLELKAFCEDHPTVLARIAELHQRAEQLSKQELAVRINNVPPTIYESWPPSVHIDIPKG